MQPARRISSFSKPTAFINAAPRNEFEQTSSHRASLFCAGVRASGFCSTSTTGICRSASCHAASHPASPPPMMRTSFTSATGSFDPGWRWAVNNSRSNCHREDVEKRLGVPRS